MAKIFNTGAMVSDSVFSANGSLRFQASGVDAECPNGAFVVLGDPAINNAYGVNMNSLNVLKAEAPAAVTDKVVVTDLNENAHGTIAGNDYYISNILYDITAPAGRAAKYRTLFLGDKFWLGEDNFTAAPTVGKFAELTAGEVELTPAATHTAGQFGVKIIRELGLTTGARDNGKKYLVQVVEL